MKDIEKIKTQAALYQVGLVCGVFEKEEIIDWCDNLILLLDNPPIEIIELSLMSKCNEIDLASKLKGFVSHFDVIKVTNLLLSILNNKLLAESVSKAKSYA